MANASEVDAYLSIERRSRQHLVNETYYSLMMPYIEDLMNEANLVGPIKIVHSTSLRSEIVEINGLTHLIHDQNIGQVFNQFNRILAESTDPQAGLFYCHKVVAQFMSNYDNLRPEAFFSIQLYHNNRRSIPYSERSIGRIEKTIMQEIYVLSHEIMHRIYSMKDHRYHSIQFVIDELCEDYLESSERAHNLSQEAKAAGYAAFPDAALGESAEYGSHKMEEQALFRQQVVHEIISSDSTKEEIFCDFWAATWTVAIFYSKGIECLEAIFLAHFHLRILHETEWAVRDYADLIEQASQPANQHKFARTFARSRINLELCSSLAVAIKSIGMNTDNIDKLVGDVVNIAYWSVRLAKMSGQSMEELGGDVASLHESYRRSFITLMADYYKKIYDGSNNLIYNGLFGGTIKARIEANLGNKGESLDSVRNEMSDPVSGMDYKSALERLLS